MTNCHKSSNFQNPLPPVHLRPQFFHPLDLGRPILNEFPPHSKTNYETTTTPCTWRNKIKTKAKPSHDTFKLNTRSTVRFSPQTMQWDHYRMALLSETRVNKKISCHAQIQCSFIKKYWKRLGDQNTRFPPPPTSDNISLLPYPTPPPQSERHMCIVL